MPEAKQEKRQHPPCFIFPVAVPSRPSESALMWGSSFCLRNPKQKVPDIFFCTQRPGRGEEEKLGVESTEPWATLEKSQGYWSWLKGEAHKEGFSLQIKVFGWEMQIYVRAGWWWPESLTVTPMRSCLKPGGSSRQEKACQVELCNYLWLGLKENFTWVLAWGWSPQNAYIFKNAFLLLFAQGKIYLCSQVQYVFQQNDMW